MPQTTAQWRKDATADELRARAAEMRGEWAELATRDRESEDFRTAKAQFHAELEDIDTHLTLHGMADTERAGNVRAALGGHIPPETDPDRGLRSAGHVVTEHEDWKRWLAAGGLRAGGSPAVTVDQWEKRALVAENDANGSSLLLPVGQPYLANVRQRKLFIRDLLSVQSTTLSNIPYVREKNPTVNQGGAQTVAEGATKPDMLFEMTPDNAPVVVIAGLITVTTQIVEDAPTLMGYINAQIPYRVKFREEAQILGGSGSGSNLKGLLTYTERQQVSGVDKAITIGNAIAKIENVDGFADGVVMNPLDFWDMVTNRTSQGDGPGGGQFDAGMFTQAPIQYVWGLPIVRANGLNQGKALVGAFQMGATLFDRRSVEVRVFEQHANYPAENKVLLRGEERVALANNRPDFFVDTTFTAPTP